MQEDGAAGQARDAVAGDDGRARTAVGVGGAGEVDARAVGGLEQAVDQTAAEMGEGSGEGLDGAGVGEGDEVAAGDAQLGGAGAGGLADGASVAQRADGGEGRKQADIAGEVEEALVVERAGEVDIARAAELEGAAVGDDGREGLAGGALDRKGGPRLDEQHAAQGSRLNQPLPIRENGCCARRHDSAGLQEGSGAGATTECETGDGSIGCDGDTVSPGIGNQCLVCCGWYLIRTPVRRC